MRQERAERTRAAAVRTTAAEIDLKGYDGTSLSAVSKIAGMSVGALTFHFPSKNDLANAVWQAGQSLLREAVERVAANRTPPLLRVIELSLVIADLMEKETTVRAAIRLSRESHTPSHWSDCWVPEVRRLLSEAHRGGQLSEDTPVEDLTVLVQYLVDGTEAYLRARRDTEQGYGSAAAQLERLWALVLTGVQDAGALGRNPPPARS
uniref:Transcriptional regulator n=1 Tax=Streptomyces carzinostaticus subsp. neocarzinostaticus TaxID=167636 RepID=Q84H98_STRCZ|nr:transcriptional regulator [Streptomyces carzinostaticus subsp. neocarzinostaticus]